MYKQSLATMAAGVGSTLQIINSTLENFKFSIHTVWRILFIWTIPVQFVLAIILFVLGLLGKVILIIPFVGFFYSLAFEIIHGVSFLFGCLTNIFNLNKFYLEYKKSWVEAYRDAMFNY